MQPVSSATATSYGLVVGHDDGAPCWSLLERALDATRLAFLKQQLSRQSREATQAFCAMTTAFLNEQPDDHNQRLYFFSAALLLAYGVAEASFIKNEAPATLVQGRDPIGAMLSCLIAAKVKAFVDEPYNAIARVAALFDGAADQSLFITQAATLCLGVRDAISYMYLCKAMSGDEAPVLLLLFSQWRSLPAGPRAAKVTQGDPYVGLLCTMLEQGCAVDRGALCRVVRQLADGLAVDDDGEALDDVCGAIAPIIDRHATLRWALTLRSLVDALELMLAIAKRHPILVDDVIAHFSALPLEGLTDRCSIVAALLRQASIPQQELRLIAIAASYSLAALQRALAALQPFSDTVASLTGQCTILAIMQERAEGQEVIFSPMLLRAMRDHLHKNLSSDAFNIIRAFLSAISLHDNGAIDAALVRAQALLGAADSYLEHASLLGSLIAIDKEVYEELHVIVAPLLATPGHCRSLTSLINILRDGRTPFRQKELLASLRPLKGALQRLDDMDQILLLMAKTPPQQRAPLADALRTVLLQTAGLDRTDPLALKTLLQIPHEEGKTHEVGFRKLEGGRRLFALQYLPALLKLGAPPSSQETALLDLADGALCRDETAELFAVALPLYRFWSAVGFADFFSILPDVKAIAPALRPQAIEYVLALQSIGNKVITSLLRLATRCSTLEQLSQWYRPLIALNQHGLIYNELELEFCTRTLAMIPPGCRMAIIDGVGHAAASSQDPQALTNALQSVQWCFCFMSHAEVQHVAPAVASAMVKGQMRGAAMVLFGIGVGLAIRKQQGQPLAMRLRRLADDDAHYSEAALEQLFLQLREAYPLADGHDPLVHALAKIFGKRFKHRDPSTAKSVKGPALKEIFRDVSFANARHMIAFGRLVYCDNSQLPPALFAQHCRATMDALMQQ